MDAFSVTIAAPAVPEEPFDESLKTSYTNESIIPSDDVWKVKLGDICQLSRFPLPASEAEKFLECLKPNDDSNEWPWYVNKSL